jgi:ATP-dependent RNA helicase DeaD
MQHSRIHSALAEALAARGYDTLTSVQSEVIKEEADNRDLIVSAKTGSGKTVAFGLAIANQLLEGDRRTLGDPGARTAVWTSRPRCIGGLPGRQGKIRA